MPADGRPLLATQAGVVLRLQGDRLVPLNAGAPLPSIPADLCGAWPGGTTYWIGLIANVTDANTSNNDTSGYDAARSGRYDLVVLGVREPLVPRFGSLSVPEAVRVAAEPASAVAGGAAGLHAPDAGTPCSADAGDGAG